ncbi:MAG: type IIL restriction-modification enzyme MmeI [Burkholderiaceae bacterium]
MPRRAPPAPIPTFPGRGRGESWRFVSTNSITQGEQVGVLWGWLLGQGVHIHFAHRTFAWSNEARGKAAVHCVIIGFGLQDLPGKLIYEYEDIRGEPHAVPAANINPYLVDAPDVVLPRRSKPVCGVPAIVFGSMANDGGHLFLDAEERAALLDEQLSLQPFVRPFLGADEFINDLERWCLWLVDAPPTLLRGSKRLEERLKAVRAYRTASKRDRTRELAGAPSLFGEIRQPTTRYVLIPRHSSERRSSSRWVTSIRK